MQGDLGGGDVDRHQPHRVRDSPHKTPQDWIILGSQYPSTDEERPVEDSSVDDTAAGDTPSSGESGSKESDNSTSDGNGSSSAWDEFAQRAFTTNTKALVHRSFVPRTRKPYIEPVTDIVDPEAAQLFQDAQRLGIEGRYAEAIKNSSGPISFVEKSMTPTVRR